MKETNHNSSRNPGGIKIAWRHLLRNKSYAFINILGLTLGITCGILIFTLVTYEGSFDAFHTDKDRIYRIVTEVHHDNIVYTPGAPAPLGKAFRNDYTFAEKVTRVRTAGDALISISDGKQVRKFVEAEGLAFAEPEFFDIFNFPLVQGDKKTFLSSPNTAAITEKLAHKYFPGQNAMGHTFRLDNKTDFLITGILKDLPGNTDRRQEIYVSYPNLKDYNPWLASDDSWGSISSSMQCFVLLKPGITPASVEQLFPSFKKKYYVNSPGGLKAYQFKLQPLSDIHFNPLYDGLVQKKYILALALVGLFLILTACVNFINLATAQSLTRAKEVGIRKVLGSMRSQLFWQFITETALIALFATVLAFCITQQLLPTVNQFLKISLNIHLFGDNHLGLFLLVLLTAVIFLSGSYPGLVLAGFQPILALKGKLTQRHIGGFSLRRILVITQFSISQLLIISTIVIAGQIHFSRKTNLGFDKDAIVLLPVPSGDKQKMEHLRTSLAGVAGVEKTSLCFTAPASSDNDNNDIQYDNRGNVEPYNVNVKNGDDQYLSTFGLTLAAGRNFYPSDTTREFLVNETLVRKLNLQSSQEIIGKKIRVNGGHSRGIVVGVVKDFHNYSFRGEIAPICISPDYTNYSLCAVKLNMGRMGSELPALEQLWNDTYPEYSYSYQFLDDSIAKFYETDTMMLTLIELFAGIAIAIGCLGLYGMVSFMAVQKTKEIGVRKVLGAGIPHILWLFGKEFVRLLLVAFLIAAPIAWYAMHKWLQDFAYQIHIGAEIFLLGLFTTFFIAALTVGYRTLKSSFANPVKSLRSD